MISYAFFFVLLITISYIGFLAKISITKKILFICTIIIIATIILVLYGHSDMNRNQRIVKQLNALHRAEQVNFSSDTSAINNIANESRPLKIKIITSEKMPSYSLLLTVDVNGTLYKVIYKCYTYPFSWAFFEDWKLIQINKI